MKIKGKVLVYGNNVNTDLIIPGRYLVINNPYKLAEHAMETVDKKFLEKAREGVILVAGRNFGGGSSREHATLALKYAGVKTIVAESVARIFFRNAINLALPVLTCQRIRKKFKSFDEAEVNLGTGEIRNITRNEVFKAEPLSSYALEIIKAGGLIKYLRTKREVSKLSK